MELSKLNYQNFGQKKLTFAQNFRLLKWRKCKFLRYPMLSMQKFSDII